MNRKFSATLPVLFLSNALAAGPAEMSAPNPADHWVATDAIGRVLPTHAEAGERRPGKLVGMFYYVWVGNHTRKVHDIARILKQPPAERQWGEPNSFHFWGEPEYGYFHASDPWAIRHDMQMLANAGIDFLFIDATNALTYPDTVRAVLEVIAEMRTDGILAPPVCFLTNSKSGATMNKIYDEIYGKNIRPDLWFRWQGKPLILGQADDPELRPEVRDFFTIKRSWAWTKGQKWFADGKDRWPWLDRYPQSFGWSESPETPEQITVSTANHPGGNQIGKSFHQGALPPVNEDYLTEFTDRGLQFEEQWSRAHEVDPAVVMVTQWNEWIAQRFILDENLHRAWNGSYAGRPIAVGDSYFVDVWNQEFNRDIAPMKGGHTDNYYYQLVGHVRRFKGMPKPMRRPAMRTMEIDGRFEEWDAVAKVYWDPAGDTRHRHFEGADPETVYSNQTGRNDIVACKVVGDGSHFFFLVETREPLTLHTDAGWMHLFIDRDQDKSTGWEGYDLAINRTSLSGSSARIEEWDGQGWRPVGTAEMAYAGNRLEIGAPVRFFRGPEEGFDFKWADNPQQSRDVTAFFLDGDAAPDRRFNYRY